jgi:hypothetical protein
VTTFFIAIAPVKKDRALRAHSTHYASSMPCFFCGYCLILRPNFGQNTDEGQAIVKFDVTKARGCDRDYKNSINSPPLWFRQIK